MTLNDLFTPALGFASLALASLACQWLAWRLRLPAILFLLLTGILVGPIGGWLSPDLFLDELLFPLVSLSVALILFEGSLTLKFSELRETGTVVRRLVTLGALVTWGVLSLATYWLIGLSPALSALFGALVVVTGPTVVVPMLRTLHAKPRIADVLRWEGILIDPLGALLAVLVFQWLIATGSGENGFLASLMIFFKVTLAGTIIGLLAGWLLALALRLYWIPEYLEVLAAIAVVLVTFSVSNHLAHESGLLAVTLMGDLAGQCQRDRYRRNSGLQGTSCHPADFRAFHSTGCPAGPAGIAGTGLAGVGTVGRHSIHRPPIIGLGLHPRQ